MPNNKCLTTIESASVDAVSRVAPKQMWCEKRRDSVLESVIWSDLHGDMQRLVKQAGAVLRTALNTMSADFFLGVPYNIASYAILTRMVAKLCGMATEELIWQGGDCHIYSNHIEQATELCDRVMKVPSLPKLIIDGNQQSIDDFTFADFKLINYNPMPAIKAPVAV